MPIRPARFATAMLLAAAAFAQTRPQRPQVLTGPSVSQVFHFTYTQEPRAMQEITNAVRSVPEVAQAFLDPGMKTLTVTAADSRVAMAAWIFATLDQPAPANQATQEYRPAGIANDVVRILYLTHPYTPVGMQEIVNAVRTVPEMTKIFPYDERSAVVLRGTDSEAAMTEWLFHQLDLPAGVQPVQSLTAHQYASPGVTNDIVQVLYLAHPWTPQSMQEIVNAVRTIPQLTKVFPCSATGAVSVRGKPATVSLATWLFSQLDQTAPAAGASPREFQMPGGADDVTQVFYLPPATTLESMQNTVSAVRANTNRPVFPDTVLKAVILRGTATQIAAADSLIKQMN